MIDFTSARSGQEIFKWNGRLLCSGVDPAKESRLWVENLESHIRGVPSVIVLGLGCGIHVIELQEKFPSTNIVVIEPNKEIYEAAVKLRPLDFVGVEIVTVGNLDQLCSNVSVRKAIAQLFFVARHSPSYQSNDKLFKEIETLLLGRHAQGFDFVMNARPELKGLFNQVNEAQKGLRLLSDDRPISIKTLNDSIANQEVGLPVPIMKLKALKELVR